MFSFFWKFAFCEQLEENLKIQDSPYNGLTLEDMWKLKGVDKWPPRKPR